ncbi:ATP-binding protein [Actinoplanes sp. NPDC051851]|uniref:sensor histidine kinase n=1 Tax=Actinoplanes sp. NPDC051851 TaxID=3154753 RepID=UPI00342CC3DA
MVTIREARAAGQITALDALAHHAALALDAPMASIRLHDRHAGSPPVPLAEALSGYVGERGTVTTCDDTSSAPTPHHALARDCGVRSFAAAPVHAPDGTPIGALIVMDREPRAWSERQRILLTSMTSLLTPPAGVLTPDAAPVGAEPVDRSDGFLTALLDSLTVGVAACDENGQIVVMNRYAREAHSIPETGEMPAPEMLAAGATLRDEQGRPIPWEQAPLVRALRESLVEAEVTVELPGRAARTFVATARPILGPGERGIGAVCVANEVTATRRTERFRACQDAVAECLRGSASLAEATPEIMKILVTALRWAGAELFLIEEASGMLRGVGHWGEGREELFGHTPVLGYGITGRVWQSGQPIWVPDITAHANLRSAYERHRVAMCLRHGVRTVLAVPVRDSGTLLGVLTCYAGAPEPHEDQLVVLIGGLAAQIGVYVALRRAEQLARQLTRAQDDFIDLIGHELRTPLTSITANATMLADEAGTLAEDLRSMVESINRNARTLQDIADTLLDLAGLESGHAAPRIEPVDLAEVVAEAVAAVRPSTVGLHLSLDLPSCLEVEGDAFRLRQVVHGLVANAITYSPPGATVRISLRAEEDTAVLGVADTGIGMPPAERARVFDRFYRGSNVRHQGIPGHGLGLSLARAVVQLHHGTIELIDNDPSGTLACVRLPLTQP